MKTIFHKNEERGKGDYGWLTTRYSFSFADWYDPSKMGFGMLRVLNDDIIAPIMASENMVIRIWKSLLLL